VRALEARRASQPSYDPSLAALRPVLSHDAFVLQSFGGVTRYFCELHRALSDAGVRSTVLAPIHFCRPLTDAERVFGVFISERLQRRGVIRATRALGQITEPVALAALATPRRRLVLHRTYYSPVRRNRKHAAVVTVYDMIHERHSELFPSAPRIYEEKRASCSEADVIIAISEYTKSELVQAIDVDPARVIVTHLGVSRVEPEPTINDRLEASAPFLLYVGKRTGYKNFERALRAFARSSAGRDGTRLVAFGGGKPTRRELKVAEELGVAPQVVFTSGDDRALAAHYATALALVYPSLDEGFGLPPLEAMLHGCPVAASAAGAIPEVAGDAAVLFDPTDEEAIGGAIDCVVSDEALRARLRSRGAARAARFTWGETARKTVAAYAAALAAAEERTDG
jgi:glycosyltransferase involved in cell wall biosynthesis